MKLRRDEFLKLSAFMDEDVHTLDIRVWKKTPTGGMPTTKGMIIPFHMATRMIYALQNLHRKQSSLMAHTTEPAQG